MKMNALFLLTVAVTGVFAVGSRELNAFQFHDRQKRSCNFKGEPCTKDVQCCTTNCICEGYDPCYCGRRPRPKVIFRPANYVAEKKASSRQKEEDRRYVENLICTYVTDQLKAA